MKRSRRNSTPTGTNAPASTSSNRTGSNSDVAIRHPARHAEAGSVQGATAAAPEPVADPSPSALPPGLPGEEALRDGEQETGAISRLGVGGGGAAVRDPAERPDRGLDDVARCHAIDVRDEPDPAGVALAIEWADHLVIVSRAPGLPSEVAVNPR